MDASFLGTSGFKSPGTNVSVSQTSMPVASSPSLFGAPNFGNQIKTATSSIFNTPPKTEPTAITSTSIASTIPSFAATSVPGSIFSGTSANIFGSSFGTTAVTSGNKVNMFETSLTKTPASTSRVISGSTPVNIPQLYNPGTQLAFKTEASTVPTQNIGNMFHISKTQTQTATNQYTSFGNETAKLDNKIDVSKIPQPVLKTSTTDSNISLQKDDPVLNDDILQSIISEEIKNFKIEFQELISRCKNINLNIGTEEEKDNLVKNADSLLDFYTELQDITDSQVAEVHYLKQALIQSFAWYEDAKSRHRRFIDPNYSTLLISQDLDPVSERQLADIKHVIYYIDSQLRLVDNFLDNQWAEFQDSCKKQVSKKLVMPRMETIYQTMVRINAILARQRYILKDIASKMKLKNKKGIPHSITASVNKSLDISSIDVELRKLKINPVDIFAMKYEKIKSNEKKLSISKEQKLCSFFTNREVFHVTPKKPKFLSSMNSSKLYDLGLSRSILQRKAQKEHSFNNSEVITTPNESIEANLSSSNVFTFTMFPDTKNMSEKSMQPPKIEQSTVSKSPALTKAPAGIFNFGSTLTATVTTITVTTVKQQLFTSSVTKSNQVTDSMIKPIVTITKQQPTFEIKAPPVLNFGLGSNVTITRTTTPPQIKKTILSEQPVQPIYELCEDPEKITFNFKTNTARIVMSSPDSKKESKPIFTSTVSQPIFTSTLSQPIFNNAISQPKFSFVAQPIKTSSNELTSTTKTHTETKTDLDQTTFNFGSSLRMGQISTPKPKAVNTINISQNSSSLVTTSITTILTTKPKDNFVEPTTTTVVESNNPSLTFSASSNAVSNAAPNISKVSISSPSTTSTFGQLVTKSSSPVSTALLTNLSKSAAVTVANNTQSEFSSKTAAPPVGVSGFSFIQSSVSSPTTTIGSSSLFPNSSVNTASIFGGEANKNSNTLFETSTTAHTLFGDNTSIFGNTVITTASGSPAATATNTIFVSAIATPTSGEINETSVKTSPGTLFGSSSANLPFQTTTTVSITSTPEITSTTTSRPIFGGTPTTSTSSVFGGNISTIGSNTMFRNNMTTVTGSLFGNNAITTTSSFDSSASTTAPNTIFGGMSVGATTVTSQSAVVTSTPTTSQDISIFGTPNKSSETPKTTQELTFGFGSLAVSSPDPNKFSFGNLTVSALSPNVSSTVVTTTQATSTFTFALPTTTSQVTGFGTGNNIFGKPATTTNTSSFLGQPICSPSSFPQNTGSPFGQSTTNIFAQKPSTTTTFGQSGSSLFGATATSPTTSTSIFMQSANSPFAPTTSSIFGTNSTFGAMNTTASSTSSIFGQNTFGNPTASSASNFSFSQNTSSFGSSPESIFGAKPTFGQAPAFGQPAVFGSTAPTFGTPVGRNVFGSSTGQTQQSGGNFGSGFGSPPSFGSPPGFGQSSFGSPPTFGGSPSFGSPQKVFGSSSGANSKKIPNIIKITLSTFYFL